ncbi:MAG: CorA family divalent cation transporter [Acetobacteraceae bacterium]
MSSPRVKKPYPIIGGTDLVKRRGKRSGVVNGLVWAVSVASSGESQPLTDEEINAILNGSMPAEDEVPGIVDKWLWLHFDTVHSAARLQVAHLTCFPREACQVLAETEYGITLEATDHVVWGAMPAFDDAVLEEDRDFCAWRFAMRQDLLVTTRRNPIPVLGSTFRSLKAGKVSAGPIGVIERTIRVFIASVRRQISRLDDEVDRAEYALLRFERKRDLGHLGAIVGKSRRRATELRRVVTPIDRVIRDADLNLPLWAEDELRDRLENQVHAALDDLLAVQERSRSLQDELSSMQVEETNRRLYIVSVATILMLPATLVTGFFGMNTGGMFLQTGALGTIWAGIVCAVFMLLTWIFLKVARLL